MKTYKTWEMIKMLTDNPKLKFQKIFSDGCIWEAFRINEGIRCHFGKGTANVRTDFLDTAGYFLVWEWQLVQEPVAWQEAIQAWADGKTIRCECNGLLYTYRGASIYLHDKCGVGISDEQLIHGKWYIKEDAE